MASTNTEIILGKEHKTLAKVSSFGFCVREWIESSHIHGMGISHGTLSRQSGITTFRNIVQTF